MGDCNYTVTAFYTTQEESAESAPAFIAGQEESVTSSEVATGNMEINNKVKIYSSQNDLYVTTGEAGILSIYTVTGALHSQRNIPAGETIIQMPSGVYLVKFANTTRKIVVGIQ